MIISETEKVVIASAASPESTEFEAIYHELRYVAIRWRMDYNHYQPDSSLDYTAPAAFAAMCLEQGSGSLPPYSRQGELVWNTLINSWTKEWGQVKSW